jgi:protein glucosyltransferase
MKERKVLKGTLVNHVPWKEKVPKAYWRGSLTGSGYIENASMVLQESRVRLARVAAAHSKDIDFAFTDIDLKDTWGATVQSLMQGIFDESLHSESVNFYEVLPQYKYLLDVDGVSVAWRGLPLLASGSVVLLETGERGEFFFEDLKPWVHYVPVKRDLTDLIDILSLLRQRDGTALRIGMSGRQFALTNLSIASLECYCLDALKFMSEVVTPLPLPELQSRYQLDPVLEPDEHLQVGLR